MVLPARRPLRLIQTQGRLELLDVEHILVSGNHVLCGMSPLSFCAFLLLAHVVAPARPRKPEDSLMRFLRMHLPGHIHKPQVGYKFGSKEKTDLLYFWMSLAVSDSLSLPWTEMNSPKLVSLAFVQARTAPPVGNVSMAVHVDVGYSVKNLALKVPRTLGGTGQGRAWIWCGRAAGIQQRDSTCSRKYAGIASPGNDTKILCERKRKTRNQVV